MAVTVRIRIMEDIRKLISQPDNKKQVADLVISQMKTSIASGLSPVRGIGRFVEYKNPAKYPGDRKAKRPVNLYLTGEMLGALNFYPTSGPNVSIGIRGTLGKIAKYNNDGTEHVPRRHFMPTNEGEEYTVTITRSIRDLYARLVSDKLSR